MKREKTLLTDLSYDVLSHILHYIASSSGGAGNIIVLSSVLFKDLSDDSDILRRVEFSGIRLPGIHGSLWNLNGFLFKCMQSENHSAVECVFEYIDALRESYKDHKRGLFRRTAILLARIRAADTANTRSRSKDLDLAREEYQKVYDIIDVDLRKIKELLSMLSAVIKRQLADGL